MKKTERLAWIAETFGADFVLPYRICRNWEQISAAAWHFEKQNIPWSIRTDEPYGFNQGNLLPFLFRGTLLGARRLWQQHGDLLLYIVYEAATKLHLNAVAHLVDPEHIVIEYNDKETDVAQRDMYRHSQNLSLVGIGPCAQIYWCGRPIRCHNPESAWAQDRRFGTIYRLMTTTQTPEITFSVRKPDKKVVIW